MKKREGFTWAVNLKWILPMPKISQKQILQQKLSPQQVLQASLLQLNLPLLEQRILQELETNPALEMMELQEEVENEEVVEEKADVHVVLVVDVGVHTVPALNAEIEEHEDIVEGLLEKPNPRLEF